MNALSHGHVEQARARKMAEAHGCGIDDALISSLVEQFYDGVRQDDMLGPIFADGVADWPRHLGRMKDFWASVMVESGRYSGNPMARHIAIAGLDAAHFARWQRIWDQTLTRIAPNPVAAARFREAARRIGNSLLIGIQVHRGDFAPIAERAAS